MKTILIAVVISLTGCLDKNTTTPAKNIDTFKIEVNEKGYVPAVIKIPSNLNTVKLLFTRTTDKTCAREVMRNFRKLWI